MLTEPGGVIYGVRDFAGRVIWEGNSDSRLPEARWAAAAKPSVRNADKSATLQSRRVEGQTTILLHPSSVIVSNIT